MGADLLCISISTVKTCPQLASTAISAACSVCSSFSQAISSLSHISGGRGFSPLAQATALAQLLSERVRVPGEGFEQNEAQGARGVGDP